MKLLIAALAFAFFFICPRMAGITSVISNATDVDLVKLAVVGSVITIPFVVAHGTDLRQIRVISSFRFCNINGFALRIGDQGDKL